METIEISPHHAMSYFAVYFLKRNPVNVYNWRDNERFQENGERLIREVVSNPTQPVRIVGSYDSICLMCPRNKRGKNFVQSEEVCTTYEDTNSYYEFNTARILRIDALMDKEPISSEEFLRHMKPCYEKILEKNDPLLEILSLKQYFKIHEFDL